MPRNYFSRLFRIKRLLRLLIGLLILWVIGWYAVPFLASMPPGLQSSADTQPPTAGGATVLDRNGQRLATLPGEDFYYTEPIPLAQVPQMFIKATLAAEDKRFYEHGGVDFLALARAVFSGVSDREFSSGASTITQQLAKISNPPAPRTVWTKIKEVLQARRIEMTLSKDQILEAYLNRLDYGNLRRGPVAAARYYFGRMPQHLSPAECAMLAGLPQGPTRLNPMEHPDRALKRRNMVLQRMKEEALYPAEMIDRALQEPLFDKIAVERREAIAPHVIAALGRENRSGVIHTTLDATLQSDARQIVQQELEKLKAHHVTQAAVIVVENATGNILCLIGSGDRNNPTGGLQDGTRLLRSPGSTLKPFVYAQALMHGAYPGTILPDVPTAYRNAHGLEAPHNYNHSYLGPVSIRRALACSQNIPAMKALELYGGVRTQIELQSNLGLIPPTADPDRYGLGLAIGNAEVRLRDLTAAYVCLARGGTHIPLQLEAQTTTPPAPRRILPESICFMVADIMADRVARQEAFGQSALMNLPFTYACKTGTSSDYRDNWCLGFTAEVTVGVWVGNFDAAPMDGVGGMDGAAPIFFNLLRRVHSTLPASFPARPAAVKSVRIDYRTGKRATDATPDKYVRTELTTNATMPPYAARDDYDAKGRALLDSRYTEWFHSPACRDKNAFCPAAEQWSGLRPHVLVPPDGSKLALDPELPGGGDRIKLETNLPSGAIWSCPTLQIEQNGDEAYATLAPGTHTITVHHPRYRLTATSTITVREL